MAITLRTWATGDELSASNLNEDKATLEAKFAGGITDDDLSSSAEISNSKLQNSDFEIVLSCVINGTELNSDTNTFWAIGGVPYDSGGGIGGYTILGVEQMLIEDGAGTGATTSAVLDLKYGTPSSSTTIKSGITIPLTEGTSQITSLAASTISISAATPQFFFLDVTTAGANYANGDSWVISIKLRRTNGLR